MQVSVLTNHLRQFYSHLYAITKKYGRLNQVVAKYFRPPKVRQTRGLPINRRQPSESYNPNPISVPANQPDWELPSPAPSPTEPSNVAPITHTFPPVSTSVPAILQRNSAWKAAAFLPAAAQIDSNQGFIVPFLSPVRSRGQTKYRSEPLLGTSQTRTASPSGLPSPRPSTTSNTTPTTNPEEQRRMPVPVSSTGKRLLQVAAGLPLIPIALAQSSIAGIPMQTPSSVGPSSNPTVTTKTQTAPSQVVPAQSTVPTMFGRVFGLPHQAVSALPSRVPIINRQVQSIPLLGFNKAVAARSSFPGLGKTNRLAESALSPPHVATYGVHTPSLSAGPPQNLSQIVSAYAESEASQARLRLNNRSVPRTSPPTQLPTLQSPLRKSSSYTSANSLPAVSTELPALGTTEGRTSSPMTIQGDTLPRLSDWEVQNFELGETEDQVSIDELRTKISKILAEELRRYLPGE